MKLKYAQATEVTRLAILTATQKAIYLPGYENYPKDKFCGQIMKAFLGYAVITLPQSALKKIRNLRTPSYSLVQINQCQCILTQ